MSNAKVRIGLAVIAVVGILLIVADARRCHISGCSNEICSGERSVPSPCIYRPENDCYRTAICERQANGRCSWTLTDA